MKPLAVLGQILSQVVERIPLERLIIKPSSNKKRLEELQDILSESHANPTEVSPETPAAEPEKLEEGSLEPRQTKVHLASPHKGLSTEETLDYQNREIDKNLNVLAGHYTQKMIIKGIPCDCGSGRHLLAIEKLAEEAIEMVDNPDAYYRLIDWVKGVGPKSTDEAAKSGKYNQEYPVFARQARDFRKEFPYTPWPGSGGWAKNIFKKHDQEGTSPGETVCPVITEEETKNAAPASTKTMP